MRMNIKQSIRVHRHNAPAPLFSPVGPQRFTVKFVTAINVPAALGVVNNIALHQNRAVGAMGPLIICPHGFARHRIQTIKRILRHKQPVPIQHNIPVRGPGFLPQLLLPSELAARGHAVRIPPQRGEEKAPVPVDAHCPQKIARLKYRLRLTTFHIDTVYSCFRVASIRHMDKI